MSAIISRVGQNWNTITDQYRLPTCSHNCTISQANFGVSFSIKKTPACTGDQASIRDNFHTVCMHVSMYECSTLLEYLSWDRRERKCEELEEEMYVRHDAGNKQTCIRSQWVLYSNPRKITRCIQRLPIHIIILFPTHS